MDINECFRLSGPLCRRGLGFPEPGYLSLGLAVVRQKITDQLVVHSEQHIQAVYFCPLQGIGQHVVVQCHGEAGPAAGYLKVQVHCFRVITLHDAGLRTSCGLHPYHRAPVLPGHDRMITTGMRPVARKQRYYLASQ